MSNLNITIDNTDLNGILDNYKREIKLLHDANKKLDAKFIALQEKFIEIQTDKIDDNTTIINKLLCGFKREPKRTRISESTVDLTNK